MGFIRSSIGCHICVGSLYIHTTLVCKNVSSNSKWSLICSGLVRCARGTSVAGHCGVIAQSSWAGPGGVDTLQARSLPTPGAIGLRGEKRHFAGHKENQLLTVLHTGTRQLRVNKAEGAGNSSSGLSKLVRSARASWQPWKQRSARERVWRRLPRLLPSCMQRRCRTTTASWRLRATSSSCFCGAWFLCAAWLRRGEAEMASWAK